MRRWIMHVDMDAFYASVEQRDNPELKGKPVIVGGTGRRSVVATASYEARKYGVHSAMSMAEARRRCPQGIFVPPRFDVYKKVSDEVHEIMYHYADAIEPIALDEAFMDISGMGKKFRTPLDVGRAIKKEILDRTGLVASAGIAPNKFLAKMASEMGKPNGLFIIPYGKEKSILAPLPVRALWGVGAVTEKKLQDHGFYTIKDIQDAPLETLREAAGNQAALLKALSFGRDDRPIESSRQAKSIGDESTYEEDLHDRDDICREIELHSDVVASRLRKHGLAARTITLKIRFSSFRTLSRSESLSEATDLPGDIAGAALRLLEKIPLSEGVRLIGVTGSRLVPAMESMNLFSQQKEKEGKAVRVMDELQKKFGKNAIRRGLWVENEFRKKQQKKQDKNI
jgi:DNA polymerase IV